MQKGSSWHVNRVTLLEMSLDAINILWQQIVWWGGGGVLAILWPNGWSSLLTLGKNLFTDLPLSPRNNYQRESKDLSASFNGATLLNCHYWNIFATFEKLKNSNLEPKTQGTVFTANRGLPPNCPPSDSSSQSRETVRSRRIQFKNWHEFCVVSYMQ
jgi:hypothetical protein